MPDNVESRPSMSRQDAPDTNPKLDCTSMASASMRRPRACKVCSLEPRNQVTENAQVASKDRRIGRSTAMRPRRANEKSATT